MTQTQDKENSDDRHATESPHGNHRCNLCRDYPVELRPVCVENRDEIPLLCSDCTMQMEAAGRLDRERDREVFAYGA